ncbi:hypothetical protein H8356DRAFT_1343076 [Neocallimastix lanati (nom. inval.)]|nr:hypothetical protein H8356DRAFT_1343076 [Neocallimastix sp. JGI-2020a]
MDINVQITIHEAMEQYTVSIAKADIHVNIINEIYIYECNKAFVWNITKYILSVHRNSEKSIETDFTQEQLLNYIKYTKL